MTVSRSIVGRACLVTVLTVTIAKAPCQTGAQPEAATAQSAPVAAAASAADAPAAISLDEALRRAEANQPAFATALADSRSAQLDRSIARAGLLPSAVFHNQYLYTQSSGFTLADPNDHSGLPGTSLPRFIANNAVHEYISQGLVNETVGLQQFAAVSMADANAAKAAAELEIARRGLVSTVVGLYYGLSSAETKLAIAQQSLDEANNFLKLTHEREQAREAAHADVLKAELQQQQRGRDLDNARLTLNNAHLELGVLLYSDPRTLFKTVAGAPPMLPDRPDVEALAGRNNAELKSALAALRAGEAGVKSARAAYLPDLALNYTYGIDAAQFAASGPDGKNLGYSAFGTVDIPLWDWLATEHKVKQSEIRRDAAKVALSAAQRRLIADLAEYYDEAVAARDQLASLDNSVTTAQESLRLTRLRYIGGEGTVLEVVDAQDSAMTVENARADAVVRYAAALANLQTLTGRF